MGAVAAIVVLLIVVSVVWSVMVGAKNVRMNVAGAARNVTTRLSKSIACPGCGTEVAAMMQIRCDGCGLTNTRAVASSCPSCGRKAGLAPCPTCGGSIRFA